MLLVGGMRFRNLSWAQSGVENVAMAALVVPKVDAGIISDVEMLLDAFKAKHSVRYVCDSSIDYRWGIV